MSDATATPAGDVGVVGASGAVGNDVVDLRELDARPEALHPRFDHRAFDATERAFIGAGPGSNRRRWSLWAAKEAAHKALRQERPQLGFAPGHYHVELDARGHGTVRRDDDAIAVRVDADPERIHAVAFRGDGADVRHALARLDDLDERDPGRGARALLLRGLDRREAVLERHDRIPCLRMGDQKHAVSLSHHGRFVAVARRAGPA